MKMRQQPASPPPNHPRPSSSATVTNSEGPAGLVLTLEHRRFTEFCDACRRYGYIGLCFGAPGVGKTLSARSYSRADELKQSDRWGTDPIEGPTLDTVLYTPSVVNAPNDIDADIRRHRETLKDLASCQSANMVIVCANIAILTR